MDEEELEEEEESGRLWSTDYTEDACAMKETAEKPPDKERRRHQTQKPGIGQRLAREASFRPRSRRKEAPRTRDEDEHEEEQPSVSICEICGVVRPALDTSAATTPYQPSSLIYQPLTHLSTI